MADVFVYSVDQEWVITMVKALNKLQITTYSKLDYFVGKPIASGTLPGVKKCKITLIGFQSPSYNPADDAETDIAVAGLAHEKWNRNKSLILAGITADAVIPEEFSAFCHPPAGLEIDELCQLISKDLIEMKSENETDLPHSAGDSVDVNSQNKSSGAGVDETDFDASGTTINKSKNTIKSETNVNTSK